MKPGQGGKRVGDSVRVGFNSDQPLQGSGISGGYSTRHNMVEGGIDGKGRSRRGARKRGWREIKRK
jgi:hypothetical protein